MTSSGTMVSRAVVALLLVLGGVSWGAYTAVSAVAADNPIVAENQQPGTTDWQLGRPGFPIADDLNKQVKGYASATSIDKGESIDFKVTFNPAQTFFLQIFRMGWYGGTGARLMRQADGLDGVTQPGCPTNPVTGLIECAWSTSYTLQVPDTWTSGIYLVLLTNAGKYQNYIQFVVRDDARPSALLYQQSVATYQAYNNYPNDGSSNCGKVLPTTGKDLYDNQSAPGTTVAGTNRAVKVSFDRPYACTGAGDLLDQDWSWEHYFVRWMERSGYDVTYSTDVDTHTSGQRLLNHRGFISVGHDEYWSGQMFDAVGTARDHGVNLAFFGGNAVYWQVRFEPSSTGVPNRVITCYKNKPNNTWTTNDPVSDPGQRTVRFKDPPVNRPPQTLLGLSFLSSTARSTNNTDLRVTDTGQWFWGGTGLTDGATIPGLVGYETDAFDCQYPLPANTSYAILASSPFTDSDNLTRNANASIYQAPSGAWVFDAGTMSWSWGLDDKVDPRDRTRTTNLHDARIERATRNLLDVFVGTNSPPATTSNIPDCSYNKTMSFEVGSLTGANGANRVVGAVALESTTPLLGNYSAHISGAAAYLDEPITAVDNVVADFAFRLQVRPTVGVRLAEISSLINYVGNILLSPNADGSVTLRLRNGSTKVGVDSAPLTVGTTYRVQLRQSRGSGANGVLQAYVAEDGSDLGAPFAQLTNGAFTTRADWVRIGSTANSSTTPPVLDAVVDDVHVTGGPSGLSTAPPVAPSALSASAVSSSQVDLRWTDNAIDESGYTVERSSDGVNWAAVTTGLPVNSTGFSDTTVAPSTGYSYRVVAVNAYGASNPSNVVSVAVPAAPPTAPSNLVATQTALADTTVSWTDNSTNETGFEVQRSVDSGFSAPVTFTVPAETTSYRDQSGEGVGWYRVRAVAPPTPPTWSNSARGSRMKDMTFEGGSLTGSFGATRVAGPAPVTLESAAPLDRAFSARFPMASTLGYLEESFPAVNELYVSFNIKLSSLGIVDTRLLQVLHGTGGTAVTAGSFVLKANGALLLRNYNTTIGTGVVLKPGVVCRIGLHQKKVASGAIQLEAFLAPGSAGFGTPFASTASTPLASDLGAGMLRLGATLTTGGLDATVDDVKVDSAFMPSP